MCCIFFNKFPKTESLQVLKFYCCSKWNNHDASVSIIKMLISNILRAIQQEL